MPAKWQQVSIPGWGRSVYAHGVHVFRLRGYVLKAICDREGYRWEVSFRGARCGIGSAVDEEQMAAESLCILKRHGWRMALGMEVTS